ncbi:hypothetical protein BDP27DRAFT_1426878 [Rhodocollybia butyracea]|uniref:Uncharacterized protein n=1 Tax=Rhodocollybia butyracea TaxID=206335 RepID=A0A9P5U2E5_9AGAR|nr:hypothetical protein BDP27DRAFT_1426878 [Rhodocollybia butyracea]
MIFTHHLLGFVLLGVLLISPVCAAPTLPGTPPGRSSPPPYSPSTLPEYVPLSYKVQVVNVTGHPVQVPDTTQILLKESIKKVTHAMHWFQLTADLEVVAVGKNLQFEASDMLYYKLEKMSPLSDWCTSKVPCYGYVVTPETPDNPSKNTYGGLLSTSVKWRHLVRTRQHFVTRQPFLETDSADLYRETLLDFLTSFAPIEKAVRRMAKSKSRRPGNVYAEALQILDERQKPGEIPFGASFRRFREFLENFRKRHLRH